jgi:hypothetical protein
MMALMAIAGSAIVAVLYVGILMIELLPARRDPQAGVDKRQGR